MVEVERAASDLLAAVEEGARDRVLALVAEASEPERAGLRKQALGDLRERLKAALAALDPASDLTSEDDGTEDLDEDDLNDDIPEFSPAEIAAYQREEALKQSRVRAAQLAITGIGARKEVEAALFGVKATWWLEDDAQFWIEALRLLTSRKVEWQGPVLLRALSYDTTRSGYGGSTEARLKRGIALVREGVLSEAAALPHLSRLARQTGRFDWRSHVGLKVIWASLEARDAPSIESAYYDVKELAWKLQKVDRGRALALALRRLGEQSRGTPANWWAQLLEAINPSDSEWVEHREGALDLVNAPTPRAAGVGITAAKALFKQGAVSAAELVPLLSGSVYHETLGVARTAVGLLRAAARADGEVGEEALVTALGGLTHPKPAVQDTVLKWLEEERWWREEPSLQLALAELLEGELSPAAAARLSRLLPEREESATAAMSAVPAPDPAAPLRASLEAAAGAETDAGRRDWLLRCRAALEGTGPVPEPRVDPRTLWRTDPPLELPRTAEETVRLLLSAAAGVRQDRPMWERIQAGLSIPIPEEERNTVARMLEPVRERGYLNAYARNWLGEPPYEGEDFSALPRPTGNVPLATPTHETGWLDPEVFAERLALRQGIPADELPELAAALYRLPDDPPAREAAWSRVAPGLSRFEPRVRQALELALGPGEPDAGAWDGLLQEAGSTWEWILLTAASRRCRRPEDDGEWLKCALALLPFGQYYPSLPDSFLCGVVSFLESDLAFEWPLGAQRLCEQRADVTWSETALGRLRTAHRREVRLRPLLPRILGDVSDDNTRVRTAAVELIAAGVADGRLYAQDLLRELAPLLARQEGRPRMQLAVLQRLAERGGVQREIAACCLERGIAMGLHGISGGDRTALLEALLAWRSAAGRAVEDPNARGVLEGLAAGKKSTRTADLARQLLQLEAPPQPPSALLCRVHDVCQAVSHSPEFASLV